MDPNVAKTYVIYASMGQSDLMIENNTHSQMHAVPTGFLKQLGPAILKTTILLTPSVLESWQGIVNTLAEFCDAPAVLIRKLDDTHMQTVTTSDSDNNPYYQGQRLLLADLFCQQVVSQKKTVLIPNSSKQEIKSNFDVDQGMIAYLGFPLLWPDGDVFGTISLLDTKEHTYTTRFENLICKFKELAETQLAMLFNNAADRKSLEYILNNLK